MRDKSYSEEVRRAFEQDNEDEKRIGQVWKLTEEGKGPDEIAQALGVSTSTFVYGYRSYIKAIEDGDLPKSTTSARDCASALRGFSKRHYKMKILSQANYLQIQDYATECEQIHSDQNKREEEDQDLEKQTITALNSAGPGIYVYTLPHYLRFPVEPRRDEDADDRTYLKVGMSDKDAFKRAVQQNTTALPEPVVVLRIYESPEGEDLKDVEGRIHTHLTDADHLRNRQRGAGKEWFLTHLKFLDATAGLLNLKTKHEIDPKTQFEKPSSA